jgi:hypothetical protein
MDWWLVEEMIEFVRPTLRQRREEWGTRAFEVVSTNL